MGRGVPQGLGAQAPARGRTSATRLRDRRRVFLWGRQEGWSVEVRVDEDGWTVEIRLRRERRTEAPREGLSEEEPRGEGPGHLGRDGEWW